MATMPALTQPTRGFPMVRLPSRCGGLPVEVCLITQLASGGGNLVFDSACEQQRGHRSFIDALDEPSAKLFGVDLRRSDPTSLYSFAVDAGGHPFHRHAGHRVFTAISGSGGAQLRFSTISDAELAADPEAFIDSLHVVDVPADSLFVVRFGGGTWHQFAPRRPGSPHPVFFALSCHTNELGGIGDPALAETIGRDDASIPSLTELLPEAVRQALARRPLHAQRLATTTLSLCAAPETLALRVCSRIRAASGRIGRMMLSLRRPQGFVGRSFRQRASESGPAPRYSLLARQFGDSADHEDMFALTLPAGTFGMVGLHQLLSSLLEGFLENRPAGVSWLMRIRNLLVRPLRLRTSPLGCPVSSLLSNDRSTLFAGRFPVLAQAAEDDRRVEVLLGADDRHLRFRSVVGIERLDDGSLQVTLGTRVQYRNLFGRMYMALIDRVHRRYIAPTMLDMAVAYVRVRHGDPVVRIAQVAA